MLIRKLNILLIDYNNANLLITEEILNEAGIPFSLNHVRSLKDAISYLQREKEYTDAEGPDLIILEAGILYRDMETWIKKIRSDEKYNKIPSAALLLFKEEEAYFRSHFLPVDCYIVKPIDLIEIDTISHVLKEFVESISTVKDNQFR